MKFLLAGKFPHLLVHRTPNPFKRDSQTRTYTHTRHRNGQPNAFQGFNTQHTTNLKTKHQTMTALHDLFTGAFGDNFNLYTTVLECNQNATSAQIKKAYHKRALKFHPDKQSSNNSSDELALSTKRFQAISAAYEILKDEDKRRVYDKTGELDDEGMLSSNDENAFESWMEVFRAMFQKVTTEDIDAFESKYKGSAEEAGDVLKYYKVCRGDLNMMLSCVMLSEESDTARWAKDIIEPAILRGEVKRYNQYDYNMKKMSKKEKMDYRSAKRRKEEKEAGDLFAAIRAKQAGAVAKKESAFADLISNLENKYSGHTGGKRARSSGRNKKKNKKNERESEKVDYDDIPEDEFERIQARLIANKNNKCK